MIARALSDVWWGFTHPADRLVRGTVPLRPPAARHRRPGRPEPAAGALLCLASAVLVAVAGAAAWVAVIVP